MKPNIIRNRKNIRYIRWSVKALILILLVLPLAYVVGAPWMPVTSLLAVSSNWFFFQVPISQSVCSFWTSYYGNLNPGAWLLCPLGGVQVLLSGTVEVFRLVPMFVAIVIVFGLIVLLGNVFCSWACPIGTIVDGFDKGVEKFLPKVEATRDKRLLQNMESAHANSGSNLLCPSCPVSKVMSSKKGVAAYGILGFALVGSAALRFNAFCAFCPMGILTRGMLYLKSVTYIAKGISNVLFPVIIEMWVFPVAAVVVSLRERRYWCRKLCPLGGLLSGVGALNPFIKPKVKQDKCVMKGCSEDCEDYHVDYCGFCRSEDNRKCEKVCPVGINLIDHGSLHRCTKCMECYIVCDHNAVRLDLIDKPEAFRVRGFFKRLRARRKKVQV